MTKTSSYRSLSAERGRSRVSSVRITRTGTGTTNITTDVTGIAAACPLPLLPLSHTKPNSDEIFTTNGKPTVKAPRLSGEPSGKPSGEPSGEKSPGLSSLHLTIPEPSEAGLSGSKPRRFSPLLVDSSRHVRKARSSRPSVHLRDKTDSPSGEENSFFQRLKLSAATALPWPPEISSLPCAVEVPPATESPPSSSSSSLEKKEPRRPSFRRPELTPAYSVSDSEESNGSSCLSASTSPNTASADNVLLGETSRHRESGRRESEGRSVTLFAKGTSNRLMEQAMAAYPNEQRHEPVDHFAVAREDEDPEAEVYTDGSTTSFERMEDAQRCLLATEKRGDPGGCIEDVQMQQVTSAASPPLAGQELRFPLCQSPRPTRVATGEFYQARTQADTDLAEKCGGLWTPGGGSDCKNSSRGLWMGTSAKPVDDSRCIAQTGLLTPATDCEGPIKPSSHSQSQFPPSPPGSDDSCELDRVNSALSNEKKISEEFHDAFITQVYNYLSLGYPSMARKFDAELSEISKVPIEELRQNDSNGNANGYVNAPEGIGAGNKSTCARWSALREYVKDWAREQSHLDLATEDVNGPWGHRAAKGSWAL